MTEDTSESWLAKWNAEFWHFAMALSIDVLLFGFFVETRNRLPTWCGFKN